MASLPAVMALMWLIKLIVVMHLHVVALGSHKALVRFVFSFPN